jgi:hypothetical protein
MSAKWSLLTVLVGVTACGGDDSPSVVDAHVDTAPTHDCSVTRPNFPMLGLGMTGMPVGYPRGTSGWFRVPSSGAYGGRRIFSIVAGLPDSLPSARDLFVLEILRPSAGFQTNASYSVDPDPNSALPAARAYIIGDLNPTTGAFGMIYWASAGSTTFANVSEAPAADVSGKTIDLGFREVDNETGDDVAGGCTTSIDVLQFYLTNVESQTATGKDDGELSLLPEDAERLLENVHKRLGR